jgi:DNA repair exonuclease SbcCD ATPase subunit
MKLRRLHIENVKCFRSPKVLDNLTDGINLFTAPNESGKSTVVEAIRAAFLERYKASTVNYLLPWNGESAAPMIKLDFEIQGKSYQLTKIFLNKKRCDLTTPNEKFSSEEAENHLAKLLGFDFSGKGNSKPEHMGIPGLLWIKQGTSQDIADTVGHAKNHLSNALDKSVSELTSSNGDAVLKAIKEQRNELLTPGQSRPRGDWDKAIKEHEKLAETLVAINEKIISYKKSVDFLTTLRQEQTEAERVRPWDQFQEELTQAEGKLHEARGLATQKDTQDKELQNLAHRIRASRDELNRMKLDEDELAEREKQRNHWQVELAQAKEALQPLESRYAVAEQAERTARTNVQLARQAAERIRQTDKVAELERQHAALSYKLNQAKAAQDRWTGFQAQADALKVPTSQLKKLRDDSDKLKEIKAKLAAVATTLEFDFQPQVKVQMGGDLLAAGRSHQTVTYRTDIKIDGVGCITILPGGTDLEKLNREYADLADAVKAALQTFSAKNLPEVEERIRQQKEHLSQAQIAEAELKVLAPNGLPALAMEVQTRHAELEQARHTLANLAPEPNHATKLPSVPEAEANEGTARTTLYTASKERSDAQSAVSTAEANAKTAWEEWAARQTTLSDPARTQRKIQANTDLTDHLAKKATEDSKAQALAKQLDDLNLPVLEQNVERFKRSRDMALNAYQKGREDIARLKGELEQSGREGLEEEQAELERKFEYTKRRCTELKRRANALDHVLQLLEEKKKNQTTRLLAPLQKHLNHYLRILFPGATLEIGEELAPLNITRPSLCGPETGKFTDLSVGAREQMGVLARLAYADLLKEAGQPTLLILDDALVHTDKNRLATMKKVIYDAAERHQILIFSCHPEDWADVGAEQRDDLRHH